MISIAKLGKHFGSKQLFDDVTLLLQAGARYGLVGANGSGKTTFLNILAGHEEASDGSVSFEKGARIGVLRQDRFLDDDRLILDVAMQGDTEAYALLSREYDASIEDDLTRTDARTLASRAGAILEGLGIRTEKHQQKLGTLSGGFKLRVLLAQTLAARPDVLLLDEPTNHLDIVSIRWLEKFLGGFAGCAVVISHDARFLDQVATDIVDVDYGTLTLYPYTYARFIQEKELRRTQKEREIAGVEAEIERKRAFVDRFGAKNTKATQAQSRLKQIERLEADIGELPPSSRRAPRFRFEIARESGKEVLAFEKVSKSYGAKRVLENVTLRVRQGERVGIIGENGIGKSTLLKIACDVTEADTGKHGWGHEARVGYFAQDHRELLEDDDTPYAFLARVSGDQGRAFVRGMLGRVLLSGDDAEKHCGALSGGEAARLVFARLMIEKPNVLVLDEPTNHLDLESIDALRDALLAYPGTLVFVSHDRAFVGALATRIVEITRAGLNDFPGTFAEYIAASGDDHLDGAAVSLKERRERRAEKDTVVEKGTDWEEQKRRKNARAQWNKRRDIVVKELETSEAQKSRIEALWASDGFYEKTARDEQKRLEDEARSLTDKIGALMSEWEDLETKLADDA